uniref:Aminotransferase class I/classII large domain-containing protein n=1 Tax=Pygocentrus nattereri TaxID=42514 RepID=A0AAR2JL09_PYGNA
MLRCDEVPQYSCYLFHRGNSIQQHQGILWQGFVQYHATKYDENSNFNVSLSVCVTPFLLLTQPDMLLMEPSLLQYPDWKGHCFLREEVAKFLSEHCRSPVPLKAENMVVMNGCGSIFCAVAAVLCDPDDAILIPSPFYGVITEDVDLYSGVKLNCVPLDSEVSESDARPFHLSAEKLEHALERAKKEGVNVRAVILVNPHNPLGEIYTAEEMTSFLNFLHAVVDEVYMLSVFGEDFSFHSVLSLERIPDAQRTHDFAMAGVRALDKLGNFHGVAGPLQLQVAQLLKDKGMCTLLCVCVIPYLKEQTFMEELCLWRERQTENATHREEKNYEDNAREMTTTTFSAPTKLHCEGNNTETESLLLADEDTVVFNCQSSSTSESLDSLIGALRQQIQSSEDPTQLDVFKELLDRARI